MKRAADGFTWMVGHIGSIVQNVVGVAALILMLSISIARTVDSIGSEMTIWPGLCCRKRNKINEKISD